MEERVVPVQFIGETKVHRLSLCELLDVTTGDPCEDATVGKKVLAPWEDPANPGRIEYEQAVIVSKKEKEGSKY